MDQLSKFGEIIKIKVLAEFFRVFSNKISIMADSEDPVDKSEAEGPSSGNLPGRNVRLKKAGDLESRRYEL